MRSGFLDERTMLKHKHTYAELLGKLIETAPDTAGAYSDKLETELDLGEYAAAERTAKRYLERFPHSEDAYLGLMNVYFSIRSSEQLKQTLEQLKRSPIRLSNRALTAVRFWSEGG
jgi:tetratricopeptide (TPR) repeat protein